MNTRKKRKFKIHTGSVFEMAFKIAETPLKGQKQFFQHLNKASPDYGGQVVI